MQMNEIKSYIITQNREYFSKNSEYIKLKNSEIKKLIKNILKTSIPLILPKRLK